GWDTKPRPRIGLRGVLTDPRAVFDADRTEPMISDLIAQSAASMRLALSSSKSLEGGHPLRWLLKTPAELEFAIFEATMPARHRHCGQQAIRELIQPLSLLGRRDLPPHAEHAILDGLRSALAKDAPGARIDGLHQKHNDSRDPLETSKSSPTKEDP